MLSEGEDGRCSGELSVLAGGLVRSSAMATSVRGGVGRKRRKSWDASQEVGVWCFDGRF